MALLSLLLVGFTIPVSQEPLQVDILPVGPEPARLREAEDWVRQRLADCAQLEPGQFQLLAVDLLPPPTARVREPDAWRRFEAVLFDYAGQRALRWRGALEAAEIPRLEALPWTPNPSPAEFQAAADLVRQDAEFGPEIAAGRLVVYKPMPPLLPEDRALHAPGRRVLTVGLSPRQPGAPPHQIVGVDLPARRILRFPEGAPPSSRATAVTCNPPADANQNTTRRGTEGTVQVIVRRGGRELWRLFATRPADSSGSQGSGIELWDVHYLGKKVLARAHVPLLNVHYDGNVCGPFRDWQYEEGAFTASGSDPAPGFRRCPTPPQTILDNGQDTGNFRGVAAYLDANRELVLTSELESGWYRYVSEWRLGEDGSILPRWGFDGVQNSCTCERHHHNAYFRFDFDLGGDARDAVQETNVVGGVERVDPIPVETRRLRQPATQRAWRVQNSGGPEFYTLLPGSNDGFADAFAVGDLWALRYHEDEIDDYRWPGAQTHLDRFVDGESVQDGHVVLWYAGHFTHDDLSPNNHIVGPALIPANW